MKLYILIAIAFLSGCIGVNTGDDPNGSSPSLRSSTSVDIFLPESDTIAQSPQRVAQFQRSEITIKNSSDQAITNYIIKDNMIKLYDVSQGWYAVYINNSLKFKIKAVKDKKTYAFLSYATVVQDNGYIYVTQTIDSYEVTHYSSSVYGREISKLEYDSKATIYNNNFISTEIKLYKKNSNEQITENMIDTGSALVRTTITSDNFSNISETHCKRMLTAITGSDDGYASYSSFHDKLNASKLDQLAISDISVLYNNAVVSSVTAGQNIDINITVSNREKLSIYVYNNSELISQRSEISGQQNIFSISELLVKSRYISENIFDLKCVCIDTYGNIASKALQLNATISTTDTDFLFSVSGNNIINNSVTFTVDTTKNKDSSLRTPITQGEFYISLIRRSDNKTFLLDGFEKYLNTKFYNKKIDTLTQSNTGIYSMNRTFSEYGQYDYSCFIETSSGDTSEIKTGSFRVAKSADYVSDSVAPEFYLTFKNQYGGKTVFYNASNEVSLDTTRNSSGTAYGNKETELSIYVKISRMFDGIYSEKTQTMTSSNGKYYCYERIQKTGYFTVTVAAVDPAGNTSVQTSTESIFIGKTDDVKPVFTVAVTDENNNEQINVGDKVKLSLNTTPNEGQAYLRAEVSASGETRSIYDEKLVTFDENGYFSDTSSSSITSSYENTNLVGVKFDVVVYVKDMAGNESVKYIPSMIYE